MIMSLSVAELNRMAADTGCSEHDDCLTCPLLNCIYDTNAGATHLKTANKQSAIKHLAKSMSVKGIADWFGISMRTVQRALKEQ